MHGLWDPIRIRKSPIPFHLALPKLVGFCSEAVPSLFSHPTKLANGRYCVLVPQRYSSKMTCTRFTLVTVSHDHDQKHETGARVSCGQRNRRKQRNENGQT
ncbi:hypothetical protein FRC18_003340 [Serendipita sp. 400]|nr:hypothetical protein FRC18_003340 [Serendipita sp. 400]